MPKRHSDSDFVVGIDDHRWLMLIVMRKLLVLGILAVSCVADIKIIPVSFVSTGTSILFVSDKLGEHRRTYEATSGMTLETELRSEVEVSFSTSMRAKLSEMTKIEIDEAQRDVTNDATIERSSLGYVHHFNIVKGKVEFLLPSEPNEVSSFSIRTPTSQFEVHSSHVIVEVDSTTTKVRCITGKIVLVHGTTGDTETLQNEEAIITGKEYPNQTILRLRSVTLKPTMSMSDSPSNVVP